MVVKQDCKMTLSRVAALKKTYIKLNIPKKDWLSVLIDESVVLEMEYPHVCHQNLPMEYYCIPPPGFFPQHWRHKGKLKI